MLCNLKIREETVLLNSNVVEKVVGSSAECSVK